MLKSDMRDIAEVEKLMIDAGITELEFRSATMQLSIRREERTPRPPAAPRAAPAAPILAAHGHFELRSRHVGKFRRRHPTRSQPVIVEGAKVSAGETLGFVGDGLLLYPVFAPQPGIVRKVAQSDGAPVGYGTILFEIEVTENP